MHFKVFKYLLSKLFTGTHCNYLTYLYLYTHVDVYLMKRNISIKIFFLYIYFLFINTEQFAQLYALKIFKTKFKKYILVYKTSHNYYSYLHDGYSLNSIQYFLLLNFYSNLIVYVFWIFRTFLCQCKTVYNHFSVRR